MAERVSFENFEAEVLQDSKAVLADFYSDSCVPCKRMSPILADIEDDYADNLKVVKININFDGELAERYDVQAVPTLIFFKNGAEAARLVGLVKKSDIEAIINTL